MTVDRAAQAAQADRPSTSASASSAGLSRLGDSCSTSSRQARRASSSRCDVKIDPGSASCHRSCHARSDCERRGAQRMPAIRSSTGSTPSPAPSRTGIAPSIGEDRRIDDVFAIVLVGARHIAGERETRQAGDRDVGRAADPELVHPAAPDRHTPRARQTSWTRFASRRPPTPADLDVDHPAGAQVERLARVVGRVDALVEADRRLRARPGAGRGR